VERKSKIIIDINAVQRLRTLLVAGYRIPASVAAIILVITYILSIAKVSNPIYILLLFIAFSPPVLLTPFIVYVLLKEKRFGWLTIFFIIVILPAVVGIIIFYEQFQFTWMFFLVFPFFFFCYFIKFSVDEWIREYNFHQQYLLQRKEQEEKKKEVLL